MADAIVLLSGGLDSATTLATAIRAGRRCHALTIAYGQRHAIEVERATRIARGAGVATHRVATLDLTFLSGSALTDSSTPVPKNRTADEIGEGIPVTYVPGRNLLFLALALAWAESIGAEEVWVGVNALDSSGYPDCTPEFLDAVASVQASGTKAGREGHPIRIVAPLLRLTKAGIVAEAVRLNVDLAATTSCYDPASDGTPCRQCDACALRARGFAEAGVSDPAVR